MLLTITTTFRPATDLGYLLHKHPDRFQTLELSVGKAHVFYPKSTEEETTAALLLDIDPIDLVRGRQRDTLDSYVNDKPYVAGSYMSVALVKAFATAMNGTCAKRPELVQQALPLTATVSVVAAPNGGETLIRRFFEPLGYAVEVRRHPLDDQFSDWGDSRYYTLTLRHEQPLHALLSHLYVLLPALARDVHYYIGKNEIQKLLDKGQGWLEDHPAREEITRRYLKDLRALTNQALERLDEADAPPDAAEEAATGGDAGAESTGKQRRGLHRQRLDAVLERLLVSGATSVVDLGCGEGKLLRMLVKYKQFTRLAGTDVAYDELRKARERLRIDENERLQERVELWQGALTYRDQRLAGFDAAALVEVIEHLDENRLPALEQVVFGIARPGTVVVTTPNAEYNVQYDNLRAGTMRHTDHRFEWTRAEFANWTKHVAETFNYREEIVPIGPLDEAVGAPSQMAVFTYGT